MNQQNFYLIPLTAVALLLYYSCSRVEHRDGFSSQKWLARKFTLVNSFGFWVLIKTGGVMVENWK